MTAICYTIRQSSNGLEIQSSGNLDSGKEIEKRLAKLLNFAMDAAMLEIREHFRNGVTIEKEGIAKVARAACKAAMENDWPEDLPRL